MQVQVLLLMGKYCLSKEEVGELLDHRFHVVTTTQDLHHGMRNFMRLARDYLEYEGPLCRAMDTGPRHIDRFERQCEKAFTRIPFFGADLVDWVHKQVQVFLQSCSTAYLDDVETGALSELGKIYQCVEQGECNTSTPIWVELPTAK